MNTSFECTKCGKTNNVTGEEPIDVVLVDIPLIINCLDCGWPNIAIWKRRVPYTVRLEESSK